MKATVAPLTEKLGCEDVPPAPSANGEVPSALATATPPEEPTKAICVSSDDHEGSVAPLRSVERPEPSGLILQMSLPHVNAIGPLSPGNAPPCAAESGTS